MLPNRNANGTGRKRKDVVVVEVVMKTIFDTAVFFFCSVFERELFPAQVVEEDCRKQAAQTLVDTRQADR